MESVIKQTNTVPCWFCFWSLGVLHSGVLRPGVLHPGGLRPWVLRSGVLHPRFLNPGGLRPGVLHKGVLNPGVLHKGVLHPGVLRAGVLLPTVLHPGFLSTKDSYNQGFLQPIVLTTKGFYEQGFFRPNRRACWQASSRFYACISSLLIKPELHSEIGTIDVNQRFFVIESNFCWYYLKNILSYL